MQGTVVFVVQITVCRVNSCLSSVVKSFDQTFSKVCGVERRSLSSPASQRAKPLCRKKAQERSKTIEYCFAWKTLAGGFPLRDSATIAKSAQISINILYYRLPVYKFTFKQHFVCHGASHLRKPPARVFLTTFLRFLTHKEFRSLRRAARALPLDPASF